MVWRIEIQIDQIWPPAGDETSSTNENHVILDGLQRRGSSHPTGYAYKDRRSRERPVLTASSVALSGKATRGSQGIPATSSSRLPRMPPTIAAIVSVSPPSHTA